MTYTKMLIQSWINMIQGSGRGVTEWESKFVENLSEQLRQGKYLSDRQLEILERIYAERTK